MISESPAKVYVLACPRSGTTYTAEVFQAAGIDVRHEVEGTAGKADWRAVVDRIPADAAVLHQIRHPLACITSMQTLAPRSFERLMTRTAIAGRTFGPDRRLEVCARAWLFYNLQCSAIADVSYRVESDQEWRDACASVGLPAIPRDRVRVGLNTRMHVDLFSTYYQNPVTLDEIEDRAGRRIADAIARLATSYGYELAPLVATSEVEPRRRRPGQ